MMRKIFFVAFCLILSITMACQNTQPDKEANTLEAITAKHAKTNPYPVDKYHNKTQQDTLLTDLITFIYVQPKTVLWKDRFNPENRAYYQNQLDKFVWVYYWVNEKDGFHYAFIIRPARSPKGHKRGVVAKYKLDKNNKITDFEEYLNTPLLAEEDIYERSQEIFDEIVTKGNFDRLFGNMAFIEFPNKDCYYDKKSQEWVYKSVQDTSKASAADSLK